MKRTAAILLFLFAFVQAAPAVCSFFKESLVVFVADEEKNNDKGEQEKKDKKDFTLTCLKTNTIAQKINTALHLTEKILPSPCLEKLTPPPNFC